MSKQIVLCSAVVLMAAATGASRADAADPGRTLIVTMTNNPEANQIKVYDAATHALLQTLPTRGKGGAGNNARGVRQEGGDVVAAVNNGSNTVALFRRDGDTLRFDRLVTTTSAPVSVDFGNDHMYVAGANTVDSFAMTGHTVQSLDGTAVLALAGGAVPPAGSTAQVGVAGRNQILVTLKNDPEPGTVDVVPLHDGAIAGTLPSAVGAPSGTLTPFGFSVNADGTALITLAHTAQDGVFRDGAFVSVVAAGQLGPCWTTRVGKYVFTANTGSGTISRLVSTGSHVFVDDQAAATITTGGNPLDVDAESGVLALVDHGAGQSHLSLFGYNRFGELEAAGSPITIGVPDANGVAVLASVDPTGR